MVDYREIVEKCPLLLIQINKDYEITFANDYTIDYLGYTKQELYGKKINEIECKPDYCLDNFPLTYSIERLENSCQKLFMNGKSWLLKKNGEKVNINFNIRLFFKEQNFSHCIITISNFFEEYDKKRSQNYEAFFNNSQDIILICDNTNLIEDANKEAYESLGYTKEELIGMSMYNISDFDTPEKLELHHKRVDEFIKNGGKHQFETVFVAKNGEKIQIDLKMRLVGLDKNAYALIIARDITEKKKLEQKLKQSEQRYKSVISEMNDLIVRFTPEMNIVFVNDTVCKYLSLSAEELTQMNIQDIVDKGFFSKEDLENVKIDLKKISPQNPFTTSEYKLNTTPDSFRWIHWVSRGIFNANGKIEEYQIVGRDITEIHNLSAVKDNFVAMVNHDIKGVFGSILATSEILLKNYLPPNLKEYLEIINKNSKTVLKMANDFLHIALFGAGKVKLNLSKADLSSLINDAVSTFNIISQTKKITLQTDKISTKNIKIDKEKIYSVLSNLISNAIKFTPENGKITIKSYIHGNEIKTHVIDTGMGIEKERQKLIFEPFTKARTKGLKREKGSGLGLSISKKIIELHGGKISVESATDKGSDFYFTLPLEK